MLIQGRALRHLLLFLHIHMQLLVDTHADSTEQNPRLGRCLIRCSYYTHLVTKNKLAQKLQNQRTKEMHPRSRLGLGEAAPGLSTLTFSPQRVNNTDQQHVGHRILSLTQQR